LLGTIENESFGRTYTSYKEIAAADAVLVSAKPITALNVGQDFTTTEKRFGMNAYRFDIKYGAEESAYKEMSDQYFNGFWHYGEYLVSSFEGVEFSLILSGEYSAIKKGSFVKITGSEKVYLVSDTPIVSSDGTATIDGTLKNLKKTRVPISEIPDSMIDYTQFYGVQPQLVRNITSAADIVAETASLVGEKLFVSFYEKIVEFPKPENGDFVVVDGKYVAITSEGDEINIDGTIDPITGSMIPKYTTATKRTSPEKVTYYPLTSDHLTQIDAGTFRFKNVTPKVFSLSGDCSSDGVFSKSDAAAGHLFEMQFSEDVVTNGKTPFVVMRSGANGFFNWSNVFRDQPSFSVADGSAFYGSAAQTGAGGVVDFATVNNFVSDESYLKSTMFPQYEIAVYDVVENPDFGNALKLADDSEFYIPNISLMKSKTQDSRYGTAADSGSGTPIPFGPRSKYQYRMELESVAASNLPAGGLYGSKPKTAIETALNWRDYGAYIYPDGKTIEKTAKALESEAKKVFLLVRTATIPSAEGHSVFVIGATKNDGSTVSNATIPVYNDGIRDAFEFEMNAAGLYVSEVIESVEDLKIKTTSNTISTVPELLSHLTGETVDLPTRDNWFVGGQIEEQTDKFKIVTQVCKQSFIAGYTNRFGEASFVDWLNDESTESFDDDSSIIDDTISNFSTSPVEKAFNEFEVKAHKENNNWRQRLFVAKVDADAFPDYAVYLPYTENGNGDFSFYSGINAFLISYTSIWSKLPPAGTLTKFTVGGVVYSAVVKSSYIDINDYTYIELKPESISPTVTGSPVGTLTGQQITFADVENASWKSYVGGVNDYAEAKEIWTVAHNSYLINKRKRTPPTDRTELTFAIDRNLFDGVTTNDSTIEYGRQYFENMVYWSTRQKLQVNYDLPITPQTITRELVSKVLFSDALITPAVGEYGNGRVVSLGVDTRKHRIKLSILFDTLFFAPPVTVQTSEIHESGFAVTDIIETGTNDSEIVETGLIS